MSDFNMQSASSAPNMEDRLLRRAFDDASERLFQLLSSGRSITERCLDVFLDLVSLHLDLLADSVPLDIYPGDEGALSLVIHNVPTKRRLEVDISNDGLALSVCYVDEHDRISRTRVESAADCVPYLNKLII